MRYTIYYRGVVINDIENAKSEMDALKKHTKKFAKGAKGTVVAVAENKSAAEHLEAVELSKLLPN